MAAMAAMACSCAMAAMPYPSISAGATKYGVPECLKLGPRSSSLGMRSSVNLASGRKRMDVPRLGCRARVQNEGPETLTIVEGQSAIDSDSSGFYAKAFLAAAGAFMPLLDVDTANAVGGEFGLFEGRTIALIHPIVMGGLLCYTLYAGYLGWQWRRVRTIQADISELKKQVKPVAVAAGERPSAPPPPSPVEAQISSLTEERKELVKGGFKDKHFNAGSILLSLGVVTSIGGCVNTWFRTGKLFPGPHLFAGAGITICWALAAALVPAMQKGSDTARNLHIGLNVINVLLFIWQIPTGWEIVEKIFQFTTWP